MRYLTFALAKGRLADQTMELLEKIGMPCEEMKEKSRKLIFINEELGIKIFLAKTSDVPTYVVGKDTILEEGRNVYEMLDLRLGKCRMAVAGPPEMKEKINKCHNLRVATKYPKIATDYFYRQKRQTVEIIKLNGSVELAPIVGLSDVIVDIVESGATLKENGLVVLEDICPLSARVIVNRVSMKMEHERIINIIEQIRQLVR